MASVLDMGQGIRIIKRHPSVVRYLLGGKRKDQLRKLIHELEKKKMNNYYTREISRSLRMAKKRSVSYESIQPTNSNLVKVNRLCNIEDWHNPRIQKTILQLQQNSKLDYINKHNWEMSKNIVNARKPGLIHRKDWEWAMGILAMERFGKLNQQCSAIGIGAGREEILFHMANKFSKVYATDIYDGKGWKNFAPTDFLEDPKKYAPIPYREEALEVLKMDGTRLDFKDDSIDVAFSFSSIEHFGGDHHFGALKSLKEMERVLKTNGIAVISTEYIINNKEHHEFFNQRTIYTDLIDKLIELRPVEPLNLSLTKNTLNSVIDYDSAVMWDTTEEINDFKLNHPLILISLNDILLTSVMLVFQKE